MKKYLLHIVLFFCMTQQLYSQEDGVVAFKIPVRNSLKFNRHFINPTFSFVRGNVITNFPDASLDNFPSNSIITINPGINYGTAFLDFGVSINNLVSYNLTTSKMIEDNPEQSVQGHIMYTGYLNSRGF